MAYAEMLNFDDSFDPMVSHSRLLPQPLPSHVGMDSEFNMNIYESCRINSNTNLTGYEYKTNR
jgi:hypothetical protein